MEPISYSDGTPVRIGDRVMTRIFLFFKEYGRVVYLPGVSKPRHPMMEHHGIKRLGIRTDTGGSGGFWIDPKTNKVIHTVTFLSRDETPVEGLATPQEWD